ncbi:MAG TPA: efflux RND transporter periplasmic adaptor subunit [Thermoanaerobaculia bacterium]
MNPKRKWLIGGGGALVVVLVVVFSIASRNKDVVTVTTTKVVKTDLLGTVNGNGRIQAQKKVDISSQVMGQIVNLAVREGDPVKKGDFLLQIDKVQYDANTRAGQAALDALFAQREADRATKIQADRDWERERKNFEAKISSEQVTQKAQLAFDSAVAGLNATERRIDQARAQLAGNHDSLNKTTLTSPISGVVTARPVEAGENAIIGTMNNPGTVLLTVSDMSVVDAEMEVDETDIPRVKLGQKAKLTLDAFPGKKFTGVVREIGGSPITKSALGTDATAVNFKVKVQLDEPPPGIRPGFSVSGEIETDRRPGTLAIPIPALVVSSEAALIRPGKGKEAKPTPVPTAGPSAKKSDVEGVFLAKKDGTVEFRKVKTGINAELQIEVLSGLSAGDEIVSGPFKALRALKVGDRVKVDNTGVARDESKKS